MGRHKMKNFCSKSATRRKTIFSIEKEKEKGKKLGWKKKTLDKNKDKSSTKDLKKKDEPTPLDNNSKEVSTRDLSIFKVEFFFLI